MATYSPSPQPSLKRLSLMQSTISSPTGSTVSTESTSVTRGPRPLQLLNGPRSPGPSSAPFHSRSNSVFHSSTTEQSPSFRRLHTPRRQSSISYSPRTRERDQNLRSSLQLGLGSPLPAKENQDKRSSLPLDPSKSERQPLTLAEKHADLLHFIAQKESKCLELRSQLAIHEAELLNLKRKWERIVSRGVDGPMVPESTGSTNSGTQAVVLDGIKEGVQGVGRFIAGLSDLAASPSPVQPRIDRLTKARADRESTSSASTYMTTTTRLSQSSASSVDGIDGEDDCQQSFSDEDAISMKPVSPAVLQNKSKALASPTIVEENTQSQRTQTPRANRTVTAATPSASSLINSSPTSPSLSTHQNRSNTSVSAFPPPSSIPGLSALSNTGAGAPLSSWVGNVGKKWGDLQKTQKRASVLLTDVSNSFFAAIASPPLSSVASPNSPSPGLRPILSSPSSTSRTSLLDDDDEDDNQMEGDVTQRLSSVAALTPDRPPSQVSSAEALEPSDKTKHSLIEEEEEEDWNW